MPESSGNVRLERWLREPAKLVGWLVAAVVALAAGLLELANELLPVLPEGWRDEVRQVVVVVGVVALVATRLQALLTRNGRLGPVSVGGAGFEGVFAPFTVTEALKPSPEDMQPGGVGPAAIVPPEAS